MREERVIARAFVGRWVDLIVRSAPAYETILAAVLVATRAALSSRSATMAVRAVRVALTEAKKAIRQGVEAFEAEGGGDALLSLGELDPAGLDEAEAKALEEYSRVIVPASLRTEVRRLVSAVKAGH